TTVTLSTFMRIRPILCWEFSSAISNGATARISKSCSRKLRHIEHSSDFAYFVGNGVDRDQYQLGFLGFGGQTGIAGTKPSRLGIRTFGKLCASMMSVS